MFHQPLATIVLIVAGGIFCLVLGNKLKVPAILFLLSYGIFFGPDFFNLIHPDVLEDIFEPVVSLLVALVLFEGGASLKFSQYKEISGPLKGLLTIGVLITLSLGAAAAYFLGGLEWRQALLFGAIMIVTGPTVVTPILKRIKVKSSIHNLLQWEAILIDPLGVILSVVVFELFLVEQIGIMETLGSFGLRVLIGGVLGLIAGWVVSQALGKGKFLKFESEEIGGLFLMGTTLFFYGVAENVSLHSGLVTATVAGVIVGNKPIAAQEQVFQFAKQITLFALSVLFILISSSIPTDSFIGHFKEGALVLGALVLLGRPLTVFLSFIGNKKFSAWDRVFISSIAPRGIVSASLATLFAFSFQDQTQASFANFLPISFMVIIGTILIYSILPFVSSRFPSIKAVPKRGILIVGANAFALRVGKELRRFDKPVHFIDTNQAYCSRARRAGFPALKGSATDPDFVSSLDLKEIGSILAMTPNHELNALACQVFARVVGKNNVFRLWDKSDNWESASSPDFDPAHGRPLVGSFETPYLTLWEVAWRGMDPIQNDKSWSFMKKGIARPGWEVKEFQADEAVTVHPKALNRLGLHFPLFAVAKGEILFLTPDGEVPSGSSVVHARPKDA